MKKYILILIFICLTYNIYSRNYFVGTQAVVNNTAYIANSLNTLESSYNQMIAIDTIYLFDYKRANYNTKPNLLILGSYSFVYSKLDIFTHNINNKENDNGEYGVGLDSLIKIFSNWCSSF